MMTRIYLVIFLCCCCVLKGEISHFDRLALLKQKGFNPTVIYDIGAFKGEWSTTIQTIFPSAHFFLFEANKAHTRNLQLTGFPYFIALLGDKKDLVTFYSIDFTGDSIFRESTVWYKEGQCIEKKLPMTTLSALVQENHLPLPDLIKMDVQGAEKLIIQGGIDIISHAEAIILETKILEYNTHAPFLYDIMILMHELGYRASDILELHYLPAGELNEVDFLFLKNDSKFIKKDFQ